MKQGYETRVNENKVNAVDALKELFSGASDYIFTDYRGLTVSQISELRTKLRENGADFRVVKNRFARIAFQQMEKPDVADYLSGPTAVALAPDDSAPVVKAMVDFSKGAPLQLKGALVAGQVYNAEQAVAFSKLPSRDELIAQLMSVMQAPVQNFVYAVNGVPTKLVRTLQAVADQKAEG
ncbi:LSU ribosomal protein L10P [Alkalispirochaeta americana]|uniref:Large ribosomal subunit protein uL10 n=1 Tax=Alkalispirochaeta americana TaxID=159291 RepID=A0A1N6NG95_9SPIO|nr:50S ribosomal protein L10 [Alkalispirochaeta americana]SIP91099.1 LSU ribosomal protein L10P [Alkalispirochaeta americana]